MAYAKTKEAKSLSLLTHDSCCLHRLVKRTRSKNIVETPTVLAGRTQEEAFTRTPVAE